MLICIDRSGVDDAAGGGPTAGASLEAIENLLLAHHAGKHVVSVQEGARVAFKGRPLSDRARAAFDRIIADRSQIEGLRKSVPVHLVAGVGPAFEQAHPAREDDSVLRAPLHHFKDFERVARSILFGENLRDTVLFDCIARAWLAKEGWRASLAHERRGGGGSSLPDEFEAAAMEGRLVLAFADSDTRYPGGPEGETWNRLKKVARGKPGYQRVRVPPVRAAENLLPLSVYDHALEPHTADAQGTSAMYRLQTLKQNPAIPSEWTAHTDFKHGVTLAKVEAMGDSAGGAFWQQIARGVGRHECGMKVRCQRAKDCECFVVDALGHNALERVVEWMNGQPPKRIRNLLGLGSNPTLDEIAAQVISWGIAPLPRKT